jgi:hypothetical protein
MNVTNRNDFAELSARRTLYRSSGSMATAPERSQKPGSIEPKSFRMFDDSRRAAP